MKILTIVGARPQFIKAAAVSRVFAQAAVPVEEVIVHTGQHFDRNMSEVFFEEMEIPQPDYNLNINSLSHGAMTGRMIEGIEALILKECPQLVLVYGDTNSTIAGALAAKKLHVSIAHVEAGLRSFNMKMPEEVNRILTDRISDLLFCPTDKAVDNLRVEGFCHFPCTVKKVGDVMQDAVFFYQPRAKQKSQILQTLGLVKRPFLLVTIHRAENTDDPARLKEIIEGLNALSKKYAIVFPMHPRTSKCLKQYNFPLSFDPIEPVGYLDMIQLLSHTQLAITDSGGLQKEAYFFRRFCLTVRDQTEWTELVDGGYNMLTSASRNQIVQNVESLIGRVFEEKEELYGGGKASQRICETLQELFS